MFAGTTVFNMGKALDRAQRNRWPVELLVEGQWVRGRVTAVDAQAAVISSDESVEAVVRLERVALVRVLADPARGPLPMRGVAGA